MDTIIHNPTNEVSPRNPEEPNEVPGADEETKSHLHSQFFGIWQVLESSYVNTTQIRNKWGCRKSSAKMKEGTFAMLLQSSWVTNGGRIPMECYFHLRNIQDLLSDGKTQYQRRFGMPLMDQYRSEQWSNITIFVRKTNLDCISSQPKFYKVYLSVMCSMWAESGKAERTENEENHGMEVDESQKKERGFQEFGVKVSILK